MRKFSTGMVACLEREAKKKTKLSGSPVKRRRPALDYSAI